MTLRRRRILGLLGAITIGVSIVPLAVLPLIGSVNPPNIAYFSTLFVGLIVFWALGAAIVLRADGNAIGWLVVLAAPINALSFAGYMGGTALALQDPPHPAAPWLVLGGVLLFGVGILLALALPLLFPTGSLPGPRWHWPVRGMVAFAAAGALGVILRPGPMVDGATSNPLTPWLPVVPTAVLGALDLLGQVALAAAGGLSLLAVAVRYRRSRDIERQQLKWCLAALLGPGSLLSLSLIGTPGSLVSNLARIRSSEGARILDVLTVLMLPLVTASITGAILRYRLYEIDRLISRTISYGLVSAVLVAVYGASVVLLQGPLRTVTGGDTVTVAASTLVVAMLFQPLRRRIHGAVDRRFNRARYDAERTTVAFAERLRNEVDLPTLAGELERTIRVAIAPSSLGLWLRERR